MIKSNLKLMLEKLITDGPRLVLISGRQRAPFILHNILSYYIYPKGKLTVSGDVSLDVTTEGFPDIDLPRAFRGDYGPDEKLIQEIGNRLRDADTDLIEIGAGIGYISTIINRHLSDKSKHIAIEANPKLISSLQTTAELNSFQLNVVNAAYSSTAGNVKLFIDENYINSTIYKKDKNQKNFLEVESVTLSTIVNQFSLGDFVLYTNMEGAEYDMLDSEFELIKKMCPIVVISFHDTTNHDSAAYVELMEQEFVRIYSHGEGDSGTHVYQNQIFEF